MKVGLKQKYGKKPFRTYLILLPGRCRNREHILVRNSDGFPDLLRRAKGLSAYRSGSAPFKLRDGLVIGRNEEFDISSWMSSSSASLNNFLSSTSPLRLAKFSMAAKNIAAAPAYHFRGKMISREYILEQRMMLAGQNDIAILAKLVNAVGVFGVFVRIRSFRTNAELQRRFPSQVLYAAHEPVRNVDKGGSFDAVHASIKGDELVLHIKVS